MQERPSVLSALAKLSAVILLSAFPALPQTQNRVIEWMKSPFGSDSGKIQAQMKQADIIDIEDVSVGGKSITIGEPFAADVAWIKEVSFRVRNVSPQPVKSVQIHVYLTEFKGPPYLDFCYGCGGTEKVLMPGDEVKPAVLLFYDWARDVIAGQGGDISTIRKASIRDIQVYLPDGTMFICVRNANGRSVCGSPSS